MQREGIRLVPCYNVSLISQFNTTHCALCSHSRAVCISSLIVHFKLPIYVAHSKSVVPCNQYLKMPHAYEMHILRAWLHKHLDLQRSVKPLQTHGDLPSLSTNKFVVVNWEKEYLSKTFYASSSKTNHSSLPMYPCGDGCALQKHLVHWRNNVLH